MSSVGPLASRDAPSPLPASRMVSLCRVFWPSNALQGRPGLLVGWVTRGNIACVAFVASKVLPETLEAALNRCCNKDAPEFLTVGEPEIIGEYHGSLDSLSLAQSTEDFCDWAGYALQQNYQCVDLKNDLPSQDLKTTCPVRLDRVSNSQVANPHVENLANTMQNNPQSKLRQHTQNDFGSHLRENNNNARKISHQSLPKGQAQDMQCNENGNQHTENIETLKNIENAQKFRKARGDLGEFQRDGDFKFDQDDVAKMKFFENSSQGVDYSKTEQVQTSASNSHNAMPVGGASENSVFHKKSGEEKKGDENIAHSYQTPWDGTMSVSSTEEYARQVEKMRRNALTWFVMYSKGNDVRPRLKSVFREGRECCPCREKQCGYCVDVTEPVCACEGVVTQLVFYTQPDHHHYLSTHPMNLLNLCADANQAASLATISVASFSTLVHYLCPMHLMARRRTLIGADSSPKRLSIESPQFMKQQLSSEEYRGMRPLTIGRMAGMGTRGRRGGGPQKCGGLDLTLRQMNLASLIESSCQILLTATAEDKFKTCATCKADFRGAAWFDGKYRQEYTTDHYIAGVGEPYLENREDNSLVTNKQFPKHTTGSYARGSTPNSFSYGEEKKLSPSAPPSNGQKDRNCFAKCNEPINIIAEPMAEYMNNRTEQYSQSVENIDEISESVQLVRNCPNHVEIEIVHDTQLKEKMGNENTNKKEHFSYSFEQETNMDSKRIPPPIVNLSTIFKWNQNPSEESEGQSNGIFWKRFAYELRKLLIAALMRSTLIFCTILALLATIVYSEIQRLPFLHMCLASELISCMSQFLFRIRAQAQWPTLLAQVVRYRDTDRALYLGSKLILLSSVSLVLFDLLTGWLFCYILWTSPQAILNVIHQAYRFLHIDVLRALITWLEQFPAGLKLNRNLNSFIGSIIFTVIDLWNALTTVIGPVEPYIVRFIGLVSLGGASLQLALCSDVLNCCTLHVFYVYVLMARLLSVTIQSIYSLFQLFRGCKWNILRKRVDSSESGDIEQRLIGTIFFAVLLFLFPTVAVFYVCFLLIWMIIFGTQFVIRIFLAIFNHFPLYLTLLHYNDPRIFSGGISLHLLSVEPVGEVWCKPNSERRNVKAQNSNSESGGKQGSFKFGSVPQMTLAPNEDPHSAYPSEGRTKGGEKLGDAARERRVGGNVGVNSGECLKESLKANLEGNERHAVKASDSIDHPSRIGGYNSFEDETVEKLSNNNMHNNIVEGTKHAQTNHTKLKKTRHQDASHVSMFLFLQARPLPLTDKLSAFTMGLKSAFRHLAPGALLWSICTGRVVHLHHPRYGDAFQHCPSISDPKPYWKRILPVSLLRLFGLNRFDGMSPSSSPRVSLAKIDSVTHPYALTSFVLFSSSQLLRLLRVWCSLDASWHHYLP